MQQASTVAGGLYFGEGPRWHQGRLWFSDFYDHAVKSMGREGDVRVEHRLNEQPSGLGWLPDGRLLVVAMQSLQVLREEPNGLVVHAELGQFARHLCNDMVVDAAGRAWVGNFGFDLDAMMRSGGVEAVLAQHPVTNLVRVDPDGTAAIAAPDLHFPNGTVITPDGGTLIVAETLAMRLTAFDIATDGSLGGRREWAGLGARAPDGITLNADGHVWVANALAPECVLVAPGGEIVDAVTTSRNCFACVLGGEDGRDLFMMTAEDSSPSIAAARRTGRVEHLRVEVPGANSP